MSTNIQFLSNSAFINGRWIESTASHTIEVRNPANGEIVGTVPNLGAQETVRAIDAASAALDVWKSTPPIVRGEKLIRMAQFLLTHVNELSELLTREQGKPISEAKKEIQYSASYFQWFAEEGRRAYGETIPSPIPNSRMSVSREPIGVCAAITPWNFPSAMVARKIAPALAAGCPIVCKPASETPLSALAFAHAAIDAGIPAGVINILTGDPEPIAGALLDSPLVRKLSFTGSTEVGKLLMRSASRTLKRLTMELGGNAPFIVFDDADLAKALEGALFAKYRNAGQTCIAANRFLLHEPIAAAFIENFAAATRKLRVGYGLDPETDIGPLISRQARERVALLVQDAVNQGATILLGGTPDINQPYILPTILTGVSPSMRIVNEEVFGPVATFQVFREENEAIRAANATEFGLASYAYTENLSRAHRVCDALEFGMVGLNTPGISFAETPFGGIKQSGFGREGGREGLCEYLSLKYCCTGA